MSYEGLKRLVWEARQNLHWQELEYRVDRPRMTAEPPVPLGTTPRLAKAIRAAVGERDFWEVTPAELLVQIDSSKQGIPKTALGLSIEIMKPHMIDALKSYGITVERRRSNGKRLLQLKCSGGADDIKARLDIVDVVSGYVPLNKAGRAYSARCPFHTERTPSFFVFPERGVWRCFGACATGGDVSSFVMRMENLDFGQALELTIRKRNTVTDIEDKEIG